jgi:hypothetical protein
MSEQVVRCLDCGKRYAEFPLDVVLPRSQWLAIHPADGGVLCAACIVKRAAKVPGATVVHAVIEIAPQSIQFLKTLDKAEAALAALPDLDRLATLAEEAEGASDYPTKLVLFAALAREYLRQRQIAAQEVK